MRKVVTKKVVNVFAIAMLIAGMYSCSSDDDNNDYKEVALTNDWLNGKWHKLMQVNWSVKTMKLNREKY